MIKSQYQWQLLYVGEHNPFGAKLTNWLKELHLVDCTIELVIKNHNEPLPKNKDINLIFFENNETTLAAQTKVEHFAAKQNIPVIFIEDDIQHTINTTPWIDGCIVKDKKSDTEVKQLVLSFIKMANTLAKHHKAPQSVEQSSIQLKNANQMMAATEHLTLSGGWEWDITQEKLYWTQGVYHIHELPILTKLDPNEAINFYIHEHRELIQSAFLKAIETGQHYDLQLNIITAKGNTKTIRTTGYIREQNSVKTHVYGSITDITDYDNLNQNNQNKEEFIIGILDNISDAVVVINNKGSILKVNQATLNLFGYTLEELATANITQLAPEKVRQEYQEFLNIYQNTNLARVIGQERQLVAVKKNQEEFPIEFTFSRIKQNNETVYIGLIKDITERVKSEQKISDLAFKDQITRLDNFNSFQRDYPSHISKAFTHGNKLCFVQVNIDHFFKINFAFGHTYGNHVLQYIAKALSDFCLKYHGLTYRISGICFVIVFEHSVDNQDIYRQLEKELLKALKQKHKVQNTSFDLHPFITAYSEYAANINQSARQLLTLLELCYKGRDVKQSTTFIDDHYIAKVNRNLLIEDKLKKAIENKTGFYLVYQAQTNSDGLLKSAEALIRWQDPELGTVYPDEFIKIAERTGLIIPLTKWVLKQCLKDMEIQQTHGITIPVSVNISANHIIQSNFVKDILTVFKRSNISPELLTLELTESAFTEDVSTAIHNMEALNKLGIKFSLDDFGTGYSNLGYLNRLPLHELKIDKRFVDNILSDTNEKQLLKTIITIGKNKNLVIVAEGVENKEQMNILANCEVDLYQGYYLSKPIKLKDFITKYRI